MLRSSPSLYGDGTKLAIGFLLLTHRSSLLQFYDTDAGKGEMNKWLTENMAKPMAEAGVRMNFLYVQVDNVLKKPGPVFNAMLKQAYMAGADYFYRLNDDTELKIGQGEGEVRGTRVGREFVGIGARAKRRAEKARLRVIDVRMRNFHMKRR